MDHSGVNGLPKKDISYCITSMSNLNLTVENEIMIVYHQYKNPMISRRGYTLSTSNATVNPLNTEFKRNSSPDKIEAGHPPSQLSKKGRCSILTEAPSDKVLSILFLNQTCSRDNKVHIQDNHDGWSTTLDGCSPWKSPGYDVTTTNRSAFVVIDLHNLVDFFRLKIQIQAVHVEEGFTTRYVSRVFAPQPQPDGSWNCSTPSWPDFHQHFVCNNKTECAGREDEMRCPDASCQQGGMLLNDRCYIFLSLPEGKMTWYHAKAACEQRGTALASFPTVNSWYDLALLSQTKEYYRFIYIGMQSSDSRHLHMYRYSSRWYNGCISHYTAVKLSDPPPYCVYQGYPDSLLRTVPCNLHLLDDPTYALCLMWPSYPVNAMSQIASVKRKTRPRKIEQIQPKTTHTYRKFPFASIVCPNGHLTQDFLAGDVFSACWHDKVRSSYVNITTDSATDTARVGVDVMSFKTLFSCQNGASSVHYSLVCNHLQDCADNSDENFCVFPPCSGAIQFRCANGQCLELRHWCDEFVQCVDESDEVDCSTFGMSRTIVRLRPPVEANFDGRGFIVYIPVTRVMKSRMACPDTHMFCPGDGYCLPMYVRCNGVYDCPDHEDEDDCNIYTCPGLYRCHGLLNTCLHPDHLCDGWSQCPQHDDELFCNMTCPVDCTCLGHAFTCTGDFLVESFSSLRYLHASGTGLKPGRLANNTMLVHLSLAHCDTAHLDNLILPNLHSLDLSDNRFSIVTLSELNLMKNLQNLSLARNPLSAVFSGNFSSGFPVHENILHVDLTGTEMSVWNMSSSPPFPNLLSLNLSKSGVTRLIGNGFRSLTSLRILDLRGCPLKAFPRGVFMDLKNLRLVFAENYKLCCEANLPTGFNVDNCQAPFNEISSCDALLRSDVYRVCLSVLAALALSGNLGCFSQRIFSLTGRGKTGFNVFVTHLCVSDFAMGVYMATIGVADRMYMGSYLWEEDRWRSSAACQVAGVLALLSSEVSAFVICLITLDRFLVIRFPFSRLRFSSFSAQVASLLTWTLGVALVTVPLLPGTGYKQFYGHTGICVPLPITRKDFAGHRYAFSIMTLLNLVIFVMIAAGQISVYLSMTSNAMSSIDTSRKSRDLIVARRLITVVVSDFLCWFPIGLLGVLAAQGVPVPGVVNVAMAVFVLPLNSALNPFLYTVNMIQEKRQRATEVKLLKLIMDRGISDNEIVNKSYIK